MFFFVGVSSAYADNAFGENRPLEERFFVANKPFSEVRTIWSYSNFRPYEIAFRKFPTLAECSQGPVENLLINWSALYSSQQVEICIFHLSEYLETPEKLSKWFSSNGFFSVSRDSFGKSIHQLGSVDSSIRLSDEMAPSIPNLRVTLAKAAGRSLSIGVGYDALNRPRSVTFIINWE